MASKLIQCLMHLSRQFHIDQLTLLDDTLTLCKLNGNGPRTTKSSFNCFSKQILLVNLAPRTCMPRDYKYWRIMSILMYPGCIGLSRAGVLVNAQS